MLRDVILKKILIFSLISFTLESNFAGIGVDDLFVIVQSWSNIPAHIHHSNSVEERIGLALKHAVCILYITSLYLNINIC